MAAYTFKRLATGLVSLIVLATVTFFLVRLIPGSPFQNGGVSSQVVEAVEEEYGLNEPLFDQYLTYMGNLVRGDLGVSYQEPDTTVAEIFAGAGSPFCGSAPWHGTWDPEGGVKEKSGPRGHFSRRDASCRNPQFCRCDPPSPCVQRETWVVSLGGTSDSRSLCAPGNLADALSDGCHLPPDRKYPCSRDGETVCAVCTRKGIGKSQDLIYPCPEKCMDPGIELCGACICVPSYRKFCGGEHLYHPGARAGVCKLHHKQGLHADTGADSVYGDSRDPGESCNRSCVRVDGSEDAPVIQWEIAQTKK